jgi:hypothetical protein
MGSKLDQGRADQEPIAQKWFETSMDLSRTWLAALVAQVSNKRIYHTINTFGTSITQNFDKQNLSYLIPHR